MCKLCEEHDAKVGAAIRSVARNAPPIAYLRAAAPGVYAIVLHYRARAFCFGALCGAGAMAALWWIR